MVFAALPQGLIRKRKTYREPTILFHMQGISRSCSFLKLNKQTFMYNYMIYNYMKTTIQINENTLELLRKIRDTTNSNSYDETINKIILKSLNKESLFGYLGKKSIKEILKGLRNKDDRF